MACTPHPGHARPRHACPPAMHDPRHAVPPPGHAPLPARTPCSCGSDWKSVGNLVSSKIRVQIWLRKSKDKMREHHHKRTALKTVHLSDVYETIRVRFMAWN